MSPSSSEGRPRLAASSPDRRVVPAPEGRPFPAPSSPDRRSGPPLVCAGALIFDDRGRLFLQRRSATRGLFPNAWDIVGGHVEPGESVEQALAREVAEETGWQVDRIRAGLPRIAWTGDDGRSRVEYDFVVGVHGDLGVPRLERGKHTEFRWVPEAELGLLREHRSVDADLEEWIALLATAARGGDRPDERLVADTATLGREVERAFVAAMRQMPRLAGGAELVRGFGGPGAVGALIEFRTSLAWPGRWVTEPEALAVARYRDAGEFRAQLRGCADAGMLEIQGYPAGSAGPDSAGVSPTGAFRATVAGHEFLAALSENQAEASARWWAGQPVTELAELLAPVLDAAGETGGPAWHAMAPVYEVGLAPSVLLLNRPGTLRYHRADAHAGAWRAAGCTAAQMTQLADGPVRHSVEEQTNVLAAPPYAALEQSHRSDLITALAALPGAPADR